MNYIPSIGLEVHVQLRTRSKLFCACGTGAGAPPNTQVCPVCLGYPGTLPVVNREAVRLTVVTGLMIGSRIAPLSRFDRKSYFYPDMPKNYQISQYDRPLCIGGGVEIETDGVTRRVGVTRIHLEEDTAKNTHFQGYSGVDFNRAGVPLMEIVSEPDLHSPEEALAYLQALKEILQYAGVSDCNLEEGNIRCDVNCSVRPEGTERLGTKTEIKNRNTFKEVGHALHHEIGRQVEVLRSGGQVRQETLRWDVAAGVTVGMRSKEYAHDYRYFPEPDLLPVALPAETVERWRTDLPELPRARRARLARDYGIPEYDAGVLAADRAVADYFEAAARLSPNPKAISNWVMTEMARRLAETRTGIAEARVVPAALAALAALVDDRTLNSTSAKEVFAEMFETGAAPAEIVQRRGLAQVSDAGRIEALADQAIAENAKSAADYRSGKKAALQFLVGQVMRLSRGKADPQMVARLLRERLAR
jgi:aspartyl-tRNA(Asn)/glutamyl-tRNA(Gln) amidotransferase subunit B